MRTYESIGILLDTDGGDEVGAFLSRPLRDDGFWQAVGAGAVAVCCWSVLRRWGVRVDGGRLDIGGIDGRASVEVPLVLVVGIRLRVGGARIKAHGCVGVICDVLVCALAARPAGGSPSSGRCGEGTVVEIENG